jgi:hypothetical protein
MARNGTPGKALALLLGAPDGAPAAATGGGGKGTAAQVGTEPATLLLVQDLSPGTPSDLLGYRPGIRAAEHRLRARNAYIGAARGLLPAHHPYRQRQRGTVRSVRRGARAWSFAPQLSRRFARARGLGGSGAALRATAGGSPAAAPRSQSASTTGPSLEIAMEN